jgi:urease accessory protein
MTTGTAMIDALGKLAAWLSPSYPVGAFSYSHGLEWAVEAGDVTGRETLTQWIADCLAHGAGRTDAILLAHAHAEPEDSEIADLAAALQPSRERLLEAEAQGAAFARTTSDVWGPALAPAPYPVAVGRAAAAHGLPLPETAFLYLHAFAANLVSAGVRLIPLGQTDGQRALAALMPVARAVAAEAITAPLDAIGGCALRADIAAMKHETQYTRLFRS